MAMNQCTSRETVGARSLGLFRGGLRVAVPALGVLLLCAGVPDAAQAVVQVLPEATLTLDGRIVTGGTAVGGDPGVKDIVAAFGRAETAVQKQDIETLMSFYAPAFNYHGLKPDGVRRIWSEVFEYYRGVSSTHLFSDVKILREGNQVHAEVTCTGGLYGTDRTTGKALTLDSWFQEVHYLVREEDVWRLLGHKGEVPAIAPFSSVPHHPLF